VNDLIKTIGGIAMAQYEVSWTIKAWYTRVIEADSKQKALEVSYDMGDGGVEIDYPDYTVSQMKAKKVVSNGTSI
jgi:hypothetical protein